MMAYKNNFAVAIRHNGKILRELGELIHLPFGSEYSILLKNKDSRSAVVEVEIDGTDVLDGNSIIVRPNSSTELKGFMKGSSVRNKFRFIEKTKKISNHRGDRIDDSLVRVEYKFEKPFTPDPWGWGSQTYYRSPSIGSNMTKCSNSSPVASSCLFSCNVNTADKGITVKGTETKQDFSEGYVGSLESHSSVITLCLVGRKPKTKKKVNGTLIKKPLTVKAKITCDICGTKSKSSAKYCRECSSYLR